MPGPITIALRACVSLVVVASLTGFTATDLEVPSSPAPTDSSSSASPAPPAPTDGASASSPDPTDAPSETPSPTAEPPADDPTDDPSDAPTDAPTDAPSSPPPTDLSTGNGTPAPTSSAPDRVLYVAVPHPDDEFEAASMYSHTPDEYKVFILMTRGESTYHCTPVGYQLSMLDGAAPPSPTPAGMQTASCEQARLNSWVKYFTAMSAADPTLPGDFGSPVITRAFPANGAVLSREPRASEITGSTPAAAPAFTDTTAQVWTDRQGRGALVNFDLGDGNLTQSKVDWAIRTVMKNRSALGLNTSLPDYGVVSAYSNLSQTGCFVYTHPDHAAVGDALRNTDYGVRFQAAATCGADSGPTTTLTVPDDVLEAAYPRDSSAGAFAASYGWLETPAVSRTDQRSLFMGVQSFRVTHQNLQTSRVSGADRYSTSVSISRAAYPTTAAVVYIASGVNYPDALSAAAAAAKQGGPLLLTAPATLPDAVAAEISRLRPSRIVIVGGEGAVSSQVAGHLKALAPQVVRLSGVDRYDTSRLVARYAFAPGPLPVAYVASGSSFADALSATSAAGAQGAPVILAPGSDPTGATVAATLRELAPKRIILVGGSAVVPAALAAALAPIAPVQRLSGADRFSTNAAVTGFAFQTSSTALVASGENFPDALAGAAWAGHLRVPLLLAHSGCLTTAIAAEVYALGTQTMTLLGGTGVVGDRIGRGVVC